MSTSADTHDREEGLAFQPKFDASGLLTCVATDAATGDVLMVAHMNDEALRKTIASGEAWYYSRSRKALWRKGESSGQTQRVVEMRMDCDQDAIWIRVEQHGAACHTGRHSCFYRKIDRSRRRHTVVICRCGQAVRSGRSAIANKLQLIRVEAKLNARGAELLNPPLTMIAAE